MNWIKRRPECNSIKDVVLANVGMSEEDFFNPSETYVIDGLAEAASIIETFIANKETITIVGDYDVDGIAASAILKLTIQALGGDPTVRLPRRFSEGYGLSEKIVDEINDGLLITVDNGITAVDAIKAAKNKGLTVILTDHHLAAEDGILPEADILIDPNAIPGSATFNSYCGAGIAYKLASTLLGEHKLMPKLLSLAAIATIADVMPLIKENRIIVKNGLKAMVTYQGRTTGLGALLEACDMDKVITEKNIAFKIAPIINAAGRMNDDGANMSFELLSFNGRVADARVMAEQLNAINEERKICKEKGIAEIEQNIIDNCLFCDIPLCIYQPDLNEGLVGIYAGQFAEKYKVPCFVFTDSDEKGILKGSGRSYGGLHLKQLLDENADVLYKYGGHAEAAGVSVLKENFELMKERFQASVPEMTDDDNDVAYYDLELSVGNFKQALSELAEMAPFGEGNPEIVFMIKDYPLTPRYGKFYKVMGSEEQHIKLFGKDSVAVGFDMKDKYQALGEPKTVKLMGMLSTNYFMGKSEVQVELTQLDKSTTTKKTALADLLAEKAGKRYS